MKKSSFTNKFVTITKIATLAHDVNHSDSHIAIGQQITGRVISFDSVLKIKEKRILGSRILTFTVNEFDSLINTFDTNSGKYTITILNI